MVESTLSLSFIHLETWFWGQRGPPWKLPSTLAPCIHPAVCALESENKLEYTWVEPPWPHLETASPSPTPDTSPDPVGENFCRLPPAQISKQLCHSQSPCQGTLDTSPDEIPALLDSETEGGGQDFL